MDDVSGVAFTLLYCFWNKQPFVCAGVLEHNGTIHRLGRTVTSCVHTWQCRVRSKTKM